MSDSALNFFLASGDNAARLAFTPSPATPASGPDPTYIWYETDTGNTFAWDFGGSAWAQVNGGLGSIADQRLLANISGGAAAPVANTLTAIIDDILGGTQGDILYRNGTVWTVLGPGTAGYLLKTGGAAANPSWADPATVKPTESLIFAASDETTALTTGTGKVTFRMPYAFTVTDIRASLVTAQTSGSIFTVDVNESGVTILSTKLTIDNTEKTSTTAVTPPVISDASLADDAEITVDIDQIGDGTAKGLKVTLIGHRT